ncbi:class I SAM-dependent methyltransferase [Paracoccus alkanivorans]|uniref:Class I SAM-dependent methyltransferase n=1 Tax=Paracoccus alkanivorans TaxID=2116655 RepID=A0A3M0MH15_9RHOB|nr:class I SAM-dependent methyltransferase [Paracoccus alkanivorans]RMC30577.1 class I SAM-dependent methyltransferase [Paracoccus alkanivorans]
MGPALRIYAENAAALAARWESYPVSEPFAPVADLFPASPCRVADIGAGPGRVAAWLAEQGHDVVAVEPVQEFRDMAGSIHAGVTWLDDSLPDLQALKTEPACDLLLLSGVWHHVDPDARDHAMASMAACLLPDGRIIMNLRHGRDDPARGLFDADPVRTIAAAERAGLRVLASRKTDSIQKHNRDAGISWTWLFLGRD